MKTCGDGVHPLQDKPRMMKASGDGFVPAGQAKKKDENLWRRVASPAGQTNNDESQWRWVRPCWTSLRTRRGKLLRSSNKKREIINFADAHIYKSINMSDNL